MKSTKKLKGFTLVELIVVLAIFSIIMFGALQLMGPVGRIFSNAYHQESMSASVDNIKRYLEGNLRYAEYVQITDTAPTTDDLVSFADHYYNGKIYHQKNASGSTVLDYANGDLYVIKIDNANGGKISQWKYTYHAGDLMSNVTKYQDEDGNYFYDSALTQPIVFPDYPGATSTITAVSDTEWAVNKAMYDDYNFNISLGVHELVNDMLVLDTDYYNSFPDDSGLRDFDQNNFSLTITAYDIPTAEEPRITDPDTGSFIYNPGYVYTANMALSNVSSDLWSYKYKWHYDPATSTASHEIIVDRTDPVIIHEDETDENPFDNRIPLANYAEPNEIYIIYSYPGEDIIK